MKILAIRLRSLRKDKRLSREKVAAAIGISSRTYQRYENDEREPDAPIMKAMADYYDVSADYLLGRSDTP